MTGVDLGQRFAFEQRDASAFERQQVSGGQSGDAAADDHDVDGLVALELGKPRQAGRVDPVRYGGGVRLHAALT